jgi:phosphoenolpyruvate-protein kinase (PTS system EI component)
MNYVHVTFFEITTARAKRFASRRVIDSSVVTNRWRQFTRREESSILRCGRDMVLVAKSTTPKDTMKFEWVKFSAVLDSRGSGRWWDRWQVGNVGVNSFEETFCEWFGAGSN